MHLRKQADKPLNQFTRKPRTSTGTRICPSCGRKKEYRAVLCKGCRGPSSLVPRITYPEIIWVDGEPCRKIDLLHGRFCIVDAVNYDWLVQWPWCARKGNKNRTFYAARTEVIDGIHVSIQMHRVILGVAADKETDHHNHNGLDNRLSNLRESTEEENRHNQQLNKNNTSGYIGVSWNSRKQKWKSSVPVNRKRIHLGYFDVAEDGARARDKMAKLHHGEFAKLNFPDE
jgi:hypothetical protein